MHPISKCFFAVAMLMAATRVSEANRNSYYDNANHIYEQIQKGEQVKGSFEKLTRDSSNPLFWRRYYAYTFLGLIARDNIQGLRQEALKSLISGLGSEEQEIRREVIMTIRDCDPPVVDEFCNDILAIVKKGRNDDVTRFAIQAASKMKNRPNVTKAVEALFEVMRIEPQSEEWDFELRGVALRGIEDLAPRADLEEILTKLEAMKTGEIKDAQSKEKIEAAVSQLKGERKRE